MRTPTLIAISAAALLFAGAAAAQSNSASTSSPASPPPTASDSAPAPAGASADTTTAPSAAPAPATGYNANPGGPPAVGDLAQAKAGDPGVVSNQPIPDTPQNRAQFGKPDSHAGRRTQPAGN